jgi:signal transduction histidine kinase
MQPLWHLLMLWPQAALLVREQRVQMINEAAQVLFGVPTQALVDRPLRELLDLTDLLDGHVPLRCAEQTIDRVDGTSRVVEAAFVQADDEVGPALLVVLHDVTELKRTQCELLRSQHLLRRLAAGMDSVQENERQRIASELHDELQQTLAAIGMELSAIRGSFAPQIAGAAARLDIVSDLTRTAIGATRRIVNALRPPILEELGLAAALEALVSQVALRTGMHGHFEADDDVDAALTPVVVTTLYRTAQEALNNVTRHAGASSVAVVLLRHDDDRILLRIADNGRGMALDDRRRPFTVGLLSMQERLRAVGGELHLESRLGAGTTVDALAPRTQVASLSPVLDDLPEPDDPLLQFLYRAPIGLIQARLDGQIEMLNPMAAQLMMPFSPDGRLDNLFTVFKEAVPHLSRLNAQLERPAGVVCESLRVELAPQGDRKVAHTVSLNVLKQGGERLMAVLSPA